MLLHHGHVRALRIVVVIVIIFKRCKKRKRKKKKQKLGGVCMGVGGQLCSVFHVTLIQYYNTTLLPSVSAIAVGMLCSGAKYTHHTFTPIIKHH